uniref:Cystathionine beta-lyase, putative n=1 Tax=Toxoplasma gondii TaxID=5811 RepID=UPI002418146B|nr:Chain A, Cystathionine beta-lyase, putative [Toxoplasma gondii]8BIV_E Chain E, Cystathionine beta-lyase, putative [Toxoplasma gondii]8BIW_A Chain A, Cystathionine beta-lyase, putative [Toxoplasma gondii]8BIW_E Chain E, Cystathionine beta-lyase, putative [Toxoplasma gondii]8BIX_A Chain A, Cystathionine beta-lyase, putative [Toxoplasma gondii]8BIX_C Chain C, Cystathionine beta-lyase, putative [Toxoplasma gondii]8BIZ_A Chain A, Cystathionine beta-lyase, putative [Toxoplasma gondii]8BIZ_E Cha
MASKQNDKDGAVRRDASFECGVKAGDWLPGFTPREETVYVHGGVEPDPLTGAILPPIYQNTTFVQESVENYLSKGFSYSRTSNPTVLSLEKKIAEIEGGFGACCFATGMAATVTIFSAFLAPGDHCLVTNCSYGGTNRCARLHFSKYNIDFEFIDFRDPTNVEKAIRPQTKVVFSESPCNPTLYLADIEAISQICKEKKVLHVCDSTFATPYMMRPLDLGADIVVQSTTKYYDGHNCTLGGAVISSTKEIHDKVFFLRNVMGNIMSAQTAFYTLLTLKTLPIRVEKQSANAQKIAEFLSKHHKVEHVIYPGIPSFPQKELALKQHKNVHGGMLAFEVKGGTEAGIRMMNHVPRPWSLCESLGACESIITCPAVFTHANMLREDRLKVGITDGFIRVSVGIEDVNDLIDGLDYALSKA